MASSSDIDGMTVASSTAMGQCSRENSVDRIVLVPFRRGREPVSCRRLSTKSNPHDTASWIVPIQR